jgi:hypothetical protein
MLALGLGRKALEQERGARNDIGEAAIGCHVQHDSCTQDQDLEVVELLWCI